MDVKDVDLEKQQLRSNGYNKVLNDAMDVYLDLNSKYERIHETRCSNLNDYIYNLIKYFHSSLREVLVR